MSGLKWFTPALLLLAGQSIALEINSQVGVSSRLYQHEAKYPQQHRQQASVFAELDIYHHWNDNQDSLSFKPYMRLDQHDNARTHADIGELVWLHVGDDWELRTGINKVFWGVNEANHLVDIINQTDFVDDISDDPKLGQAMINLNLIQDWGILDLFILPGFRERTFAGIEGRLRGALAVATDQARYESSAANKHVDIAMRWSHTIDDYDIALSYFRGTDRQPQLQIQTNAQGQTQLIPYYQQIQQFGFDAQATLEAWLLKFEAIYRQAQNDEFIAVSGGFEYSFIGLFESNIDLGWITEYSWDQRRDNNKNTFQNDIMLGWRFAFNDAQSSDLLLGVVQDLDQSQRRSIQLEASRRLGNDWKLNLELRVFSDKAPAVLTEDDHLQLSLSYYF